MQLGRQLEAYLSSVGGLRGLLLDQVEEVAPHVVELHSEDVAATLVGGGQVDGVLQLARRLPADRLEPFNGVLREGLLLLAGNGALGRWSGTIPLALACLNTLTSMARLVGRLWRHRVKELSEHLMVIWSSGLALMALSS